MTVDVNAYTLFGVNPGLNTFCQKVCPGRESHWLRVQNCLDALLAWRTPAAMLCDSARLQWSVGSIWNMCSRAVHRQVGMAPLLPVWALTLGQFLGLSGNMVPHALHGTIFILGLLCIRVCLSKGKICQSNFLPDLLV